MREILIQLNQRPISYYPIYKRITGSTTAGILLSQLMYWWAKMDGREFYKTDAEIMEETELSVDELRGAKVKLKKCKFLKISHRGVPCKTYYWIIYPILMDEIAASVSGKTPNQFREFPETGSGEFPKQDSGNSTDLNREIPETLHKTTHKNTRRIQQENAEHGVSTSAFPSILDDFNFKNKLAADFPAVPVLAELETLKDYLAASGKKYKDYAAFARNWMRRAEKDNANKKNNSNGTQRTDKALSTDPLVSDATLRRAYTNLMAKRGLNPDGSPKDGVSG